MLEKRIYLLPNYYKKFKCKCNDCRHTCCQKWRITLSLQEYFKLNNLQCSKDIKNKINESILLLDEKTNQKYAYIKHNEKNKCPFNTVDGLCLIHKKYGEKVLPAVCKFYPRSVCSPFAYECSCANSCEGVIELLLKEKEGLIFSKEELIIDIPENLQSKITIKNYEEIRNFIIRILQNRSKDIQSRLFELGNVLLLLQSSDFSFDTYKINNEKIKISITDESISLLQKVMKVFLSRLNEDVGIINYHDLLNLMDSELKQKYIKANERYNQNYSEYNYLFENILVNHLFYINFPFSTLNGSYLKEYIALVMSYFLMKTTLVLTTENLLSSKISYNKENEFVDVIAGVYKIIEHSNFNNIVYNILDDNENNIIFIEKILGV